MDKLPNPKYLYLALTSNCNYKCKTCDCWKSEKRDPLDINTYKKLLSDFKKISPEGKVIFTGGEPTIYYNILIELLKYTRQIKLNNYVNTNGSIFNKSQKYIDTFLLYTDDFFISLNSHIPEVHNKSRGVKNSFETIMSFIKDNKKRCDVSVILGNFNIDHFKDFYFFCKEYFKRLQFNIEFDNYSVVPYPNSIKILNKKNFFNIINFLINNYDENFIMNPLYQFKELKQYINNYHDLKIKNRKCLSPLYNIMVDSYGDYSFCFYTLNQILNHNRILGNIKNISLLDIYNYNNYTQVLRKKLLTNCNKWCMINNCHLPIY